MHHLHYSFFAWEDGRVMWKEYDRRDPSFTSLVPFISTRGEEGKNIRFHGPYLEGTLPEEAIRQAVDEIEELWQNPGASLAAPFHGPRTIIIARGQNTVACVSEIFYFPDNQIKSASGTVITFETSREDALRNQPTSLQRAYHVRYETLRIIEGLIAKASSEKTGMNTYHRIIQTPVEPKEPQQPEETGDR